MKRFQVRRVGTNGELLPASNNHYLVVNVDEPYAPQVFELIKRHEQKKGPWDCPESVRGCVLELIGGDEIAKRL